MSKTIAHEWTNLATYLNDHLAGSVAALEMLDYLLEKLEGPPIAVFLQEKRTEIQADQDVLREIIAAIGASESGVRKAGAWMMEKLGRAKLGLGEMEGNEFGLFQGLEGLIAGVSGKLYLWTVLRKITPEIPPLAAFDFLQLEKRAQVQRDQLEAERLALAPLALARATPA